MLMLMIIREDESFAMVSAMFEAHARRGRGGRWRAGALAPLSGNERRWVMMWWMAPLLAVPGRLQSVGEETSWRQLGLCCRHAI